METATNPLPDTHRHAALLGACRTLHASDAPVPLHSLARDAGMSVSAFQRLFRSTLGVTPRQYASHLQRERAQAALGRAPRITDAILDAGFATPSRFYERARGMLGMSPSAWRDGGAGVEIEHAVVATPLGALMVAATSEGVCRVAFGESAGARDEAGGKDDPDALVAALAERFPKATLVPGGGRFRVTAESVAALAGDASEARRAALALPLDIEGTVFQNQVWQVLRGIPVGRTMSYAAVAAALGRPSAHRAVASACGANPVALLIPCHRVVRTGGAHLGGYRWGVGRKRALLARESGSKGDIALSDRSRPCTGT